MKQPPEWIYIGAKVRYNGFDWTVTEIGRLSGCVGLNEIDMLYLHPSFDQLQQPVVWEPESTCVMQARIGEGWYGDLFWRNNHETSELQSIGLGIAEEFPADMPYANVYAECERLIIQGVTQ